MSQRRRPNPRDAARALRVRTAVGNTVPENYFYTEDEYVNVHFYVEDEYGIRIVGMSI